MKLYYVDNKGRIVNNTCPHGHTTYSYKVHVGSPICKTCSNNKETNEDECYVICQNDNELPIQLFEV